MGATSGGVNGPSPRAWGLRKTSKMTKSLAAVHPHVRGVYGYVEQTEPRTHGPSPRAWGLLSGVRAVRLFGRSIPTCVGFTRSGLRIRPGGSVHPHVRGVYSLVRPDCCDKTGPSPRAWGLPWTAKRRSRTARSIPTCVGFTSALPDNLTLTAVHPHVRGVYTCFQLSGSPYFLGPSPRAWGLRSPTRSAG